MRQILSTFKKSIALRMATAALFISASTFSATAAPLAPLEITGISPASGPKDGGTSVTLTGSGFTGTETVYVDMVDTSFSVVNDTQLTFTTPSTSTLGPKNVLILGLNGMASTTFTYAEPAPVEVKKPTLTITSPSANTKTLTQTSGTIKVKGKASDLSGIKSVKLLYGDSTTVATLSTENPKAVSWTADVNPPGTGPVVFTVVAEDIYGNVTTVDRKFKFVRRYTMGILRVVEGEPSTAPDLAGTVRVSSERGSFSTLTPAKAALQTASVTAENRITLTATAAPGYIFKSWLLPSHIPQLQNLSESLSSRVISFTAPAEDFSDIRAIFIANPFLGLGSRPTLVGVLTPAQEFGSSNSNHGFVQVALVTATGSFTGHVLHDGKKTSFTGQVNGDNSVWFKGPKGQEPELRLSRERTLTASFVKGALSVEVHDQTQIPTSDEAPNALPLPESVITMSGVAKAASTTTDEALLNSAKQGFYTVALPSQTPDLQEFDSSVFPQGAGIGSLKLSTKGIATFALRLADGSITTVSTRLIKGSTAVPFYVQTRTPGASKVYGGSISGEFTLDPESPELLESEGLIWFRPEVDEVTGTSVLAKETQIYTEGWEDGIIVGLFGAQYDTTQTAEEGLDLDSPTLELRDGKLSEDLYINSFTIAGNKVVKENAKDKSYNLSFSQSTGTVTGSFQATPGKAKTINGIQITKGPYAGVWGYFLSNTAGDLDPQSGSVRLTGKSLD